MALKNKRRGIGAVCSIQKRHLHSKKVLNGNEEFKNADNRCEIPGWKIVGTAMKVTNKRRGKPILCALLENPLYPNDDPFYCSVSYAKVVEEGPIDQFFEVASQKRSRDGSARGTAGSGSAAVRSGSAAAAPVPSAPPAGYSAVRSAPGRSCWPAAAPSRPAPARSVPCRSGSISRES